MRSPPSSNEKEKKVKKYQQCLNNVQSPKRIEGKKVGPIYN